MVHQVSKRKLAYRAKLEKLLSEHKTILVITANHVGSKQIQQVRQVLRGRASILMGKNTMIRMILREYAQEHSEFEAFIPCVVGNCGFVFTNEDVKVIRDVLISNKVPAMARPGIIAPNNVLVPPGPTGCDPGQTSFFQALNIPTKIVKGQIEITNEVALIAEGDKVGSSECALLDKLNIRPFEYGLKVASIFDLDKLNIRPFEYGLKVASIFDDGAAFSPEILDLTADDLAAKFFSAVRVVAALGLRLGIPNLASVPHSFANAFKKILAISVATEYIFDAAKPYKEFLADPEAYAAAHGLSMGGAAGATDAAATEEAAPEEEEEEESSAGGGMGMFGSDSDSD
eukprot:870367_1